MKKYELTGDMSQAQKYRITKIMAGPAKEMVKKARRGEGICHRCNYNLFTIMAFAASVFAFFRVLCGWGYML